jgi:hypothetical protein
VKEDDLYVVLCRALFHLALPMTTGAIYFKYVADLLCIIFLRC